MNLTRGSSSLFTLAYSPDAPDHLVNADALVAQFVSDILPPQSIAAQTVFLNMLGRELVTTNNLQLSWALRAFNVGVSSSLAELIAITRNGVELGTAISGASSSVSIAATDINEPWRLVLEVGFGGTPTTSASTDGHNGELRFGEVFSSSTNPSFPQHGDTTSAGPPFLLFSADLKSTFDADGASLAIGL